MKITKEILKHNDNSIKIITTITNVTEETYVYDDLKEKINKLEKQKESSIFDLDKQILDIKGILIEAGEKGVNPISEENRII